MRSRRMMCRVAAASVVVCLSACSEDPTQLAPDMVPVFSHSATPSFNPANGHFYELVTTPISWASADAAAQASSYIGTQGHLATITSADENAFVSTLIAHPDLDWVWLGGYQPACTAPSAGWEWVTGEPFVYTNWTGGEPNDSDGPCSEEFINIHGAGAHPDNFTRWNDLGDNREAAYLIEYDGVTAAGVCELVKQWVSKPGVANSMCQQLANGAYGAFRNHVRAQSGKSVSPANAATLIGLSNGLG